jgi:L-amino acid N-acyltransferase YncA
MPHSDIVPERHPVIRCSSAHLPAIRSIYNEAILNSTALYEYRPKSEQDMAEWWVLRQQGDIPVLGIEPEAGTLAGFATWGPFRRGAAYKYTAEHSVYVDSRFRGAGIGRVLLDALVKEAVLRGLHLLVGGIDAANPASIRLHRAAGFRYCGTIREAGFKFGKWLDVEFWQLTLPTPKQPEDG